MAPRTTTTTPVPTAAPAAEPMTTLSGFNVSVLAFIPIDPKDLRKQAEIPLLLLDIQEGKKTVADLAPYLKDVEFRQQHIRKRFTKADADKMMGPVSVFDDSEGMTHTPETTDLDEHGREEDEIPGDGDAED
jgi:hypothetical protein